MIHGQITQNNLKWFLKVEWSNKNYIYLRYISLTDVFQHFIKPNQTSLIALKVESFEHKHLKRHHIIRLGTSSISQLNTRGTTDWPKRARRGSTESTSYRPRETCHSCMFIYPVSWIVVSGNSNSVQLGMAEFIQDEYGGGNDAKYGNIRLSTAGSCVLRM